MDQRQLRVGTRPIQKRGILLSNKNFITFAFLSQIVFNKWRFNEQLKNALILIVKEGQKLLTLT
jgi:hypothetical protein